MLVYHTSSGMGNSFQQLHTYFQRIWNESCVKENKGHIKESVIQKEFEQLSRRYAIGELAKSRSDIVIQTPYAVCNNDMYDVLKNMDIEADVSIILNAV